MCRAEHSDHQNVPFVRLVFDAINPNSENITQVQ